VSYEEFPEFHLTWFLTGFASGAKFYSGSLNQHPQKTHVQSSPWVYKVPLKWVGNDWVVQLTTTNPKIWLVDCNAVPYCLTLKMLTCTFVLTVQNDQSRQMFSSIAFSSHTSKFALWFSIACIRYDGDDDDDDIDYVIVLCVLRFPPRNVVKRHTVSPKTGRCSHCGSMNGNQRGYTSSSDV